MNKSKESLFNSYASEVAAMHLKDDKKKTQNQIIPIYLKDNNDIMQIFNHIDWSFADEDTTYLSHDIHPYPAKFPPQLPAHIIQLLSSFGELVWDPFGGSGTTALEAVLANRNCVSTDINPIGSIIGTAKTTALKSTDEHDLNHFIEVLEYYIGNPKSLGDFIDEHQLDLEKEIPAIPNIEKWFSDIVICELAFLKYAIKSEMRSSVAQTIARASFSKIITRVSNQENETTYRAVKRESYASETVCIFLKDLKNNFQKIKNLSSKIGFGSCEFVTTNVMAPIVGSDGIFNENSVDLIVTSPPYPNAFDYHLYHRFRIFWLDSDPRQMGKVEIGSHLKYQRGKKSFKEFEDEMTLVLKNCFLSLKEGRFAVFILGNAVFDGVEYQTAERIGRVAENIGFEFVGIVNRPLPDNKRSVKNWARRATDEQILILKKPSCDTKIELVPVEYKQWPYEKEISKLERKALCGQDTDVFSQKGAFDENALKKLTFYKAYRINGIESETWQHLLEHGDDDDNSSRKDPKYLTHGIHPYKGKFYPQLVRPLLNILNVPVNGNVFDPFCGSGTVALEAILNGYNAYGCDVNPIAVEIATAKNTIFKVLPYEFEKFISAFKQELKLFDNADYDEIYDKDALDEIKSWFPDSVISKMGFILSRIEMVPDERIRCFLKVILSSIIREISQQEPSDLRIRRRKNPIDDAPVIEMYEENLDKQVTKINTYYSIVNNSPESIGTAEIWRGNSTDISSVRKHIPEDGIDIVITSPPYATALPYIDTNRLNMLVLKGYNSSKRVPIEAEMTGTREIKKSLREYYEEKIRQEDYESITSKTGRAIISKIYQQNIDAEVGFRKKNMAALIYMYFRDMSDVIAGLNAVVKKDGYICIVIGDTKTTTGQEKVIIRTTEVLRETGKNMGWELIYDIPISVTLEKYLHMNNSITENNILVFKK